VNAHSLRQGSVQVDSPAGIHEKAWKSVVVPASEYLQKNLSGDSSADFIVSTSNIDSNLILTEKVIASGFQHPCMTPKMNSTSATTANSASKSSIFIQQPGLN
jgi:hypothetical protein